jgi:hypothetical protein
MQSVKQGHGQTNDINPYVIGSNKNLTAGLPAYSYITGISAFALPCMDNNLNSDPDEYRRKMH